jgi:hypothetical protein
LSSSSSSSSSSSTLYSCEYFKERGKGDYDKPNILRLNFFTQFPVRGSVHENYLGTDTDYSYRKERRELKREEKKRP